MSDTTENAATENATTEPAAAAPAPAPPAEAEVKTPVSTLKGGEPPAGLDFRYRHHRYSRLAFRLAGDGKEKSRLFALRFPEGIPGECACLAAFDLDSAWLFTNFQEILRRNG